MRKKLSITIAIIMFISALNGISAAYDRGHVYIGGRVDYISGNSITVSGVDYTIDSTCKVVITFKERDSFHERPARLSDVRRGDPVYVKKIGTVLYEINIEGWKR